MNTIKSHPLFKTICFVLIAAFIVLDVSWSYPMNQAISGRNPSAPSNFQQRFEQSIFSQSALLTSVYDIGEYFFGDAEKHMTPLPSRFAKEVIGYKLDKTLEEADITIKSIVPVGYLTKTAPNKIKTALDKIGFKGTLPDEGVVFILYEKGDAKFLVQIAKKAEVSPKNLPGYEWVISDRYVVKYIPEDYVPPKEKALEIKDPKTKEVPQAIITEPIAEIQTVESETRESAKAAKKTRVFNVRAIIASLSLVLLTSAIAVAGDEGGIGKWGNLRTTVFFSALLVNFLAINTIVKEMAGCFMTENNRGEEGAGWYRSFIDNELINWSFIIQSIAGTVMGSAYHGGLRDFVIQQPMFALGVCPLLFLFGAGTLLKKKLGSQMQNRRYGDFTPVKKIIIFRNPHSGRDDIIKGFDTEDADVEDTSADTEILKLLSELLESTEQKKFDERKKSDKRRKDRGKGPFGPGNITRLFLFTLVTPVLIFGGDLAMNQPANQPLIASFENFIFMHPVISTAAALTICAWLVYRLLRRTSLRNLENVIIEKKTPHPKFGKPSDFFKNDGAFLAPTLSGGILFWPERDFKQGESLDVSLIKPGRTAEEVLELLRKAKDAEIELSITGHLRGLDGPGSSLDLPEFQKTLTSTGAKYLEELPSTPTIASRFEVKIKFELAENKNAIEYVAPDYGITEEDPYVIEGEVELTKKNRTPHGQKDAPAYIFKNIFGLRGIKMICDEVDPVALAGGMESSNVFNVALIAAASKLSGANLSDAEIFSLAVKLENDEFGGLTGGQGHLCALVGGAYRHVWLSGIKDKDGNFVNPYSALSVPLLGEEQLSQAENHIMLVQAGKKYVGGKAELERTATLTNNMWTDLLRDGDKDGLLLHGEKLGLAANYTQALRRGDFETVINVVNRYVDIRDALCKRWINLMLDAHEGKAVPEYAKEYAGKVFDPENSNYNDYDVVRNMFEKEGQNLRALSLYTLNPIADLIAASRDEGIAIMPLGAGGPGANLIAISSKGIEHLKTFFENKKITEFTREKANDARKIIRGTKDGELKGYVLFKTGKEPLKYKGFERLDEIQGKIAAGTESFRTGEEKAPLATGSATGLFEIVEQAAGNRRTEFVKAANELTTLVAGDKDLSAKIGKEALDKRQTTVKLKSQVENIIAAVYGSNMERLPENVAAKITQLEKGLDQFEADGIATALITLARRAKKEKQDIVIPIALDGIPGYLDEASYQSQAIKDLVREIESIPDMLKHMGLDNAKVVFKDRRESVSEWIGRIREAIANPDDLSNVFGLACDDMIKEFRNTFRLGSMNNEKRPFLASINPEELVAFYSENGESRQAQLKVQIMTMLSILFDIALGKDAIDFPDNFPIVVRYTKDDKEKRMVFFLPKPKKIKYSELLVYYNNKKLALHSA